MKPNIRFSEIVRCILNTGGEGYITAGRKMVSAQIFSNTSLRCSALSWKTCYPPGPVTLTWHYRNRTLQNSTKYSITEEQKTNNCKRRLLKAESILKIFNVTDEDAGGYFCQMKCYFMTNIENDSIELVTFVKPGGTKIHIFYFFAVFCPLILNDVFYADLFLQEKQVLARATRKLVVTTRISATIKQQ